LKTHFSKNRIEVWLSTDLQIPVTRIRSCLSRPHLLFQKIHSELSKNETFLRASPLSRFPVRRNAPQTCGVPNYVQKTPRTRKKNLKIIFGGDKRPLIAAKNVNFTFF
ncbi:MAG: hypothetical protein ACXWP5_11135, partial [Bdellovibrionota bacterium]